MTIPEEPQVEALLKRAQGGDDTAASELVLLHDEALRRVIRLRLDRRLAQRLDVEDVLQETRVEAHRRLPEFLAARGVSLLVWMRFLAVQRCVTLARRHLGAGARDVRREQPLNACQGDATSMALAQALSASLTTPSRAAVRDEVHAGVREAVQSLEALDREIICVRHFEGLDNNKAAEVLSITPAAASKRYIRAMTRLRDVLAAAGLYTPPDGPS